jgi:hypothetical protein
MKSPTNVTACQRFPDPLGHIFPFRSLSFLAGAAGTGKTALVAGILAHFHREQPIFGHQPGRVSDIGVIAADRGWLSGGAHWFALVGYPGVKFYSMLDDPFFDPKTLRKRYERTMRLTEMVDRLKLRPGGLLFVDPLGLFLGGNLNDYDGCAIACHEIRAMLRERNLTMLATAHTSKMKADKRARYLRPQDAILGSAAQHAYGDTQCYLAAPEEIGKPYYEFTWHPHMTKPETFRLERDEQGLFVPYSGADRGNCARVLALLPENGAEMELAVLVELAEAIPLSRRTVIRVLQTLVEEELVEKKRYGVYARVVVH